MAEYRFSAKIVSRGSGQSVIAKAAYNAREAIRDERTGQMKDYSRGKGLEFSGIFAPKNAPEWMKDRAQLWNAVELQEDGTTRHATAQLARNIELSLPHELNADQRRQLVRDFVREQFVRQGMVADVAIHAPDARGDERNYHAHILLTLREIDGDGFSADKARHWNSKEFNLQWREKWAELGARYLAKAGFEQEAERYSYSHLTLKEQFRVAARRGDLAHAETLDREPTKHLGPQAAAMERRGVETERGQRHSETVEANKLRAELREVEKQIAEIQAQQPGREHNAPQPGRGTLAGGREKEGPVPSPSPAPTPQLGRTAREIRQAYTLTRTGQQQFATALEDSGLILAHTTASDAERLNRWEAQRMKEQGKELHQYQKYRAGELVVVNQHGDVYKLTRSNTGDDAKARAECLKDIDRAALLNVSAAQGTMQQFRQDQREEKEQRKRDTYRPQEPPEELTGTAAKILLAHYRSDSARSFAAALAEKGIAVAITTREDAERSQSAAAAAFMKGSYAPVYREGEIVAVTDRATVYRLNESTTGSKFADMQRYMRTLDTSQLRGIEAAKQMMHDRAAERGGAGPSIFGQRGGNREQDILDRAERRTIQNERAASTRETQHTVLDRATRRTMENERAQGPRNTRDR